MTEKYGPQTAAIKALLARAATLTEAEADRLDDVPRLVHVPLSWDLMFAMALIESGRAAVWEAAWDKTMDVGLDSEMDDGAYGPMFDAIQSLMMRDLIGQYGITQGHYDVLTEPWAVTIGKVHPDD